MSSERPLLPMLFLCSFITKLIFNVDSLLLLLFLILDWEKAGKDKNPELVNLDMELDEYRKGQQQSIVEDAADATAEAGEI